MASMDYGIIPIMNKKIEFRSLNDTGAGVRYNFGNLEFYKLRASELYSKNEDRYSINFEEILDWQNKISFYWEYQGIQYKTKKIGKQLYLTSFKHYGKFTKLIHGYDVDTEHCYDPSRLKKIKKIINRK